jgi:DNA polymerase-3 subunit delta'
MSERLPEDVDAIDDLPLPRERERLVGQAAAEAEVLDVLRTGRFHHAWLLCGPEGIGKATFAFRLARFLLANAAKSPAELGEAADLDVPAHSPVARQIARLSHPDLFVLRRALDDKGKIRGEISVKDARKLLHLFETTSGALGWRIAIVDAADDLNRNASNALLKMLEEPPPRALFLIVAHQPDRLLPTIRSRCRRLDLAPLDEGAMDELVGELAPHVAPDRRSAAIARASGSARRALTLLSGDGIELVAEIEAVLDALPRLDPRRAGALADKISRPGTDNELALFRETLADWARGRIRAGTRERGAVAGLARLAETVAAIAEAHATADVFNLDKRQLVLRNLADLADALGRRSAA